jgi:glutamate carboxypeptidase
MLEKIRGAVQARYGEIMSTIETLSTIDRGSRYVPGLRQTADFLSKRLEELGCAITVYDHEEYGPTVVGRKQGKGKARILMFAHMDTVWPEGTCAQRPFHVEGKFAYGPGVSDCVHGMIGALYSLQALNDTGFEDYGEIIILFNPDEELYSPSSKQWIEKYARISDVAFCMEGPDFEDQYITSRGGVIYYDIEVAGVKSHAGVNPKAGRNAIEELCHKVTLIHQLDIPGAIPQVTLINGGIAEGVVPDRAWAHVDIRVDTFEAIDAVHAAMKEIEQNTLIEGTTTSCSHRPGGCLPLVKTPHVEKFVELIDKTSAEVGYPLHESFCGGGADAWISALAGTPTIDGLVPMSYFCHTEKECLDLDSIVPRITIMAAVLARTSMDDRYLRLEREDA